MPRFFTRKREGSFAWDVFFDHNGVVGVAAQGFATQDKALAWIRTDAARSVGF